MNAIQQHAQRVGGSRKMVLYFACNDPNCGVFAGRVEMVEFGGKDWTASLESTNAAGLTFTVDYQLMRFRMHRIWFPFVASKDWYGNWCWNAYSMKRPQAIRLLRVMRDSGLWHCTEAPTRIYHAWNLPRCPHTLELPL